jgi:hypothetical protein
MLRFATYVAGYSGTPLIAKLGLKPPMHVLVVDAPTGYLKWLGELPQGILFTTSGAGSIEAAHAFVSRRAVLEKLLPRFRRQLHSGGFVWISWPKKASGVATDITENTIREVALPLGFVDVKVCAVSNVWSGLKLVIRKEERR